MDMKRFVISAAAVLAGLSAYAQIPYEVLQGASSVTSKTYDFIARTDPSAKATINGVSVPVYKTGAFGNRFTLEKGVNKFTVVLQKGSETLTKEFEVTLADPAPSTASASSPSSPVKVDFWAKTTGTAYLQFGDGEDRLGGCKMGFLDEGILLQLEEKQGTLYKARLSDNRFAYIDEEYLDFCQDGKRVKVNSGNIRVSNSGTQDRISIPLGVKLPYASWTETDPTRICIDIYGAMNNSNWITHSRQLGIIDYVDVRQSDSDVMTVVIDLKKKYSWGYSVSYEGTNLVIKVKHTPSLSLKDLTIGLDAGHGGTAPGAVSATGLTESEINLKLCYLVKDLLEAKGAKVVLTRTSVDQTLSMAERKKTLLDANVDMLLSIHNNAGGSPFVPMGTSTYYKHIVNRDLALCVYDRMLELGVAEYNVTGNFNFSLCAPTEYPDVLLEAMFMSSLPDDEKLHDDAFCKALAKKVTLALEDYLKMVRKADGKVK